MIRKIVNFTFLVLSVYIILSSSDIYSRTIDGDSLSARVDEIFARWDKPNSPGCALGIIKDGNIVYARGYGMANLEYDIPITSKTVFRIGSTSKQFTAMCIALLAERGELSLDDNIRKYLPELPEYHWPITIRHLIYHTSGIRDYLTLMDLSGLRDDDFLTEEEVLDLIVRQKQLNFTPGEEHLYSNSGYFLLSVIVKRVSGQSLREFAHENIFQPLGMNNTHFHDNHNVIVKNRASGYSHMSTGEYQINMTTLDMVGDGGVFTTVEDLFRWDQNFYNNTLGKGGHRLIEQMIQKGSLNDGKVLDYAFGLGIGEYKGVKRISHGGAFVGFRAEMIRFPEEKFSVICLANLNTMRPTQLVMKVTDLYLKDIFQQTESQDINKSRKRIRFKTLSTRKLKDKTGTYRNQDTGEIWKIFLDEDKLMLKTQRGRQFQIAPVTNTKFIPVSFPLQLSINFQKQKSSQSWMLHIDRGDDETTIYEAIDVVHPDSARFVEYVGDFYSDELMTTYRILLQDSHLIIRHENRFKNYPKKPLEPTLKDAFFVSGLIVHFFRNRNDHISGFILNAGRVKNIRFMKK